MKNQITFLTLLLISFSMYAQNLTQTVRGKVIDQDSKMEAIGATIFIVGSDPIIGASVDMNGNFRLENVPVGRVTLKVSYMGYEDKVLSNIEVTSGKEVILNIPIIESLEQIEAVEAVAQTDKRETQNEMSLVSSRTFSVEETKRYAGAINDPARAVSAFAGVNSNAEGNNDIIVRGNSPKGILWRMEGVEIPNPNHFSQEGSTGGAISALNSEMLANSDFSTGAFAPQYGNALSGVFDMQLRTGNNEQREYTFGLGVLGVDLTAEGPFKKGGKSSYLANYRYSSLGLLDNAGVVDFGGVPKYQDGSFKLRVPTKKMGVFNAFGLGGISNIVDKRYSSETEDTLTEQTDAKSNLGIVGVSNLFFIDNKTYLETKISAATNGSGFDYQKVDSNSILRDNYIDDLSKNSYRISATLNRKINAKNKVETGLIYSLLTYNLASKLFDEDKNEFETILDKKGNTGYLQGYASLKHRLNDDITIVGGVHYMQLMLNNSLSIEPRLSAQWKLNNRHTLNGGMGFHSKIESLLNYFSEVEGADGSFSTPNTDLGLSKAAHFVLGYDYSINENAHIKFETYYQHLYNVPVENDKTSSNSIINSSDGFNNIEYTNEGTGKNYGLEVTLERFLNKNFYYLFSGSIYDSKYTALDGVERDTKFNGNYTGNFLIGKEFNIGKKDNKTLSVNTKFSYLGGNRYTPVNLEQSIVDNETVYFENKTFGEKAEDVFIMNFGATYKVNRKKTTHSIKLEMLNATNNQSKLYEYYDSKKQIVDYGKQLNLIPNLIYQVQF